jgi:hypothetical protein
MPYKDIRDTEVTISQDPGANPSFTFPDFQVPNVALVERPVLSFRVTPNTTSQVQLQMTLNKTVIVDVVFSTNVGRVWQEIAEANILLAPPSNNTLIASVVGSPANSGDITIADVVMTYNV